MDIDQFKKKTCAWATSKPDGGLFWENGIFEGDDDLHYFFLIGGKLRIYLKTEVKRLEFGAAQIGGDADG